MSYHPVVEGFYEGKRGIYVYTRLKNGFGFLTIQNDFFPSVQPHSEQIAVYR